MSDSQKTLLQTEPSHALFEGQIQGLVVSLYQNERPPSGLSGLIDWHLQGALSQRIQSGIISGQVGECTYFPFSRHQTTFHILFIGAGYSHFSGERLPLAPESIKVLQKNLLLLKLPKIGISKLDFGNVEMDYFSKHFKGVPLWITP